MTVEDAVRAEEQNDLVTASREYEFILRQSPAEEIFVNALVLYWQATDYGVSSNTGLEPSFVAHAGDRLESMLKEADNYGPLAAHWAKLIKHLDFGEGFSDQDVHEDASIYGGECRELAFFPFFISGGLTRNDEIYALVQELRTRPATMRTRYLQSVIASVLATRKRESRR